MKIKLWFRKFVRVVFLPLLSLPLGAEGLAQTNDFTFGSDASLRRDVRLVNGITVDLTPVHRWLHSREGERPMKHWKQFQVYSIKDTYAGWPRCVVKDEDGLSTEIRIANLPAEIPKFIEQYRQLEARIARLRSEIEARERSVREASAVTPIATSDPQRQIQRERVNLAAERVRQEKEDLAKLEEVRKQMFDKSGNRTSILAMFSGRKYGSLDVWDCGRQKQ